jgi:hypothetical protein
VPFESSRTDPLNREPSVASASPRLEPANPDPTVPLESSRTDPLNREPPVPPRLTRHTPTRTAAPPGTPPANTWKPDRHAVLAALAGDIRPRRGQIVHRRFGSDYPHVGMGSSSGRPHDRTHATTSSWATTRPASAALRPASIVASRHSWTATKSRTACSMTHDLGRSRATAIDVTLSLRARSRRTLAGTVLAIRGSAPFLPTTAHYIVFSGKQAGAAYVWQSQASAGRLAQDRVELPRLRSTPHRPGSPDRSVPPTPISAASAPSGTWSGRPTAPSGSSSWRLVAGAAAPRPRRCRTPRPGATATPGRRYRPG